MEKYSERERKALGNLFGIREWYRKVFVYKKLMKVDGLKSLIFWYIYCCPSLNGPGQEKEQKSDSIAKFKRRKIITTQAEPESV